MNAKLNLATTIDYEFYDGTKVKCTLAMYKVKALASKNKSLYNTVTRVLAKGVENVFDQFRVLYAAYLCANMDGENLLSEDEFLMNCGSDYTGAAKAIERLTNPKKAQDSENHSD